MTVGVTIGFLFTPAVQEFNSAVSVGTTNIPIAVGLEWPIPQIDKSYESGKMPALLPGW
jgi:hypothetical protein